MHIISNAKARGSQTNAEGCGLLEALVDACTQVLL